MFTKIVNITRKNPNLGVSERRKIFALSQLEGALNAAMVGGCEIFSLYYAVRKGIAKQDLAIISTMPMLLGALANWIIPQRVSSNKIKTVLLCAVFTQLIGVAGLFFSVTSDDYFGWILISLSLYWIGNMTASPLWTDWMSGWLPEEKLGRYLSRRNGVMALITVLAYFAAAFWIYRNENTKQFLVVFGAAFACRLISFSILAWQPSPPGFENENSQAFKLSKALKAKPIWLMIFFTVVFRFVASISSPFFLPYMIDQLHFSLFDYAWITAVPYISRALFLKQWGEAVESFRPFVGLQVGMLISAAVCLLWTFTVDVGALTFIEGLSGIAWAGIEFCGLVILYNFAPRRARGLMGFHLSLYHGATLAGSLIGSRILQTGMPFLNLATLSAGLRFSAASAFILVSFTVPEMRASLKLYQRFFVTALSLKPSFFILGRFISKTGIRRSRPNF
jgi:MFS family permease